ncbi:MAG: hypothetical protein IH850_10100 [Acidobacteria bacterium]|nr:hypothetical protein [Acidobacteriota bacterium]
MRRLVAAATVLAFAFGGFLVIPSGSVSAAVAQWVSYKDKFDERDYDGNNEDGKFSSDWIEVGEANGPVKGHASVTGHSYCKGAYCLQVGGGGLAVGNVGIERSINLDRALEAKVTFLYARDLMGGSTEKEIAFQVSADAGESFTTLETFRLDDDFKMVRVSAASGGWIDITEFAAPQTVIRFISLDGAPANLLLVDDVLVKGKFVEGPPPATTTTTTTTTTTLPPTTTTTTLPPTTTTTTLPPTTTTTTTEPPDSTSTTTTLPPTTTTTAPPVDASTGLPPPGSDESFRSKEGLVALEDVARHEVPSDQRDQHTEPVSIMVRFQTTAETFTGGALPSTILGVLMALLAVIGLSRRFRPLRIGDRARTQ